MVTRNLPCALLVFVCMLIGGMGVPASPVSAQQPDGALPAGDYRIGPEDVLEIAVWNNTAISRTVPVRADGKISLPILNDVHAAGLTPMELQGVLAKMLVTYIPTPEVSVIVREVRSFKVSVLGEVRTPGRFELRTRATVLDLIAMAGGFNEFAARGRIVILRLDGTAVKRLPFNYNKTVSGGAEQENLFVQPGDTIVVP